MSFVKTNFPLPSVTRNTGVIPFPFAPGRCAVDFKTEIARRPTTRRLGSIRAAVPRTRLTVMPGNRSLGELAGFWDSLVKGVTGAVKGFAVGGPAGAIAGGAGGAIQGSTGSGKQNVQVVQQQQQLGPLANISTGVLVTGIMSFSALLLVLASRGR
jgi:hypothetical protein